MIQNDGLRIDIKRSLLLFSFDILLYYLYNFILYFERYNYYGAIYLTTEEHIYTYNKSDSLKQVLVYYLIWIALFNM